MSEDFKCSEATPSGDLYRDLMDHNIPKSEREWFAADTIARLEAEVERLKEKLEREKPENEYDAFWHMFDENKVLRSRAEQAEGMLAKVMEKIQALIDDGEEVPNLEITSGNMAKMLKQVISEDK